MTKTGFLVALGFTSLAAGLYAWISTNDAFWAILGLFGLLACFIISEEDQ